ncbi:protein QUIRKY [Triticum aestivum]|uniref:protein QUIRKY n=1 Tax=Triticum aestivum TaxID=4565 RepID=UPI000843CDD1|nr:protein QUIRKY-like [Triticum aestivum]
MDHKATTAQRDLEHILVEETAEPKALPLSLLEDMTDHFSDDLEIGRGGFAVVYKGKLGDKEVAVKRLSEAYMHEKEFDREIQCLVRAKHKNVVRFLGYCDDRQRNMERCDEKFLMADIHQRLFCFEYMPKGSLDKYINTHHEWETCYKIIKGICEGLQYLHDNSIIHLDLKPANILLDDDMVPKITDFGLSRCLDENQSQVFTKTISGTMGYLAPERYGGSGIKPSGDLYSLGIIIMEILTGQKQPQDTKDVLETWSDRLERSQQDTVYEQIRVCNEIASNCMQLNPKDRPASAGDIIDRLHEMERIQGWFEEIFYLSPEPAQLPGSAYRFAKMKPLLPVKLGPRNSTMAATKMLSPYDMVEPMSYLCVSVVKARDLPTMDITSVLHPYVEVKLGNFKGVTQCLEKNANPVWQQLFTISGAHLQSNQLQVIVKHKDVLRDDFVGRVVFDMSDIPNHSPPHSWPAPQWHHLSDARGKRFPHGHSLGEIMLAVCLATQVDEALPEAWHSEAPPLSFQGLTNTRSKVYYSPKLIYLKVAVIAAQDLIGTEEDRLAESVAKIQIGSQIRRTRPGKPQGSVNPTWNEEFMFVASEPFEDELVVTVEEKVCAGRAEPIGRIIIPLADNVPRNDLAKSVPSKWFSLSHGMMESKDKESFKTFASKIRLRMSLETTYHVMYESMNYISDLQPAAGF